MPQPGETVPSASATDVEKDASQLYLQLRRFSHFLSMNREGFRKIMKKHDKLTDVKVTPAMQPVVQQLLPSRDSIAVDKVRWTSGGIQPDANVLGIVLDVDLDPVLDLVPDIPRGPPNLPPHMWHVPGNRPGHAGRRIQLKNFITSEVVGSGEIFACLMGASRVANGNVIVCPEKSRAVYITRELALTALHCPTLVWLHAH
jgi:hypothetical protein